MSEQDYFRQREAELQKRIQTLEIIIHKYVTPDMVTEPAYEGTVILINARMDEARQG